MGDVFEHVIRLEVVDDFSNIPSCFGIGSIIEEELENIHKQVELEGNVILQTLGEGSQTIQRAIITEKGAVRTGRLRESVVVELMDNEVRIGTDLYYAGAIHEGHGNLEPRPWSDIGWERFEPTIDTVVDSMLSSLDF